MLEAALNIVSTSTPCKYPALTDKRTGISVREAQTTRLKRRMPAKGHLYFAVLLFLLKRATETRCTSGSNFLVVFPENIAYFYPEEPHNRLLVTALHDNAKVTLAIRQQTHTEILAKAQTRRFFSNGTTELGRENVSDKVLRVSSTRRVTVQVVSVKAGSVQSARVLPVDALGTEYLVPRVPENQNTTQPPDVVCAYMTEFAPFRLIVVNAEKVNTVSLEGDNITKEVELEPHHAAQFWLDGNEVWRVVRAKHPVAVLFGHPCAATLNCGCSMLYVTLNPKPHGKMAFLVPPLLSQASEDQTALLLSQEDASSVDSSYPGWPLLELSGIAAVLHRPGLLLPLIPQSELASCYVVNAVPDVYNFAVILVHKDLATGVRVGSSPLEDPTWLTLTGTDYVSTVLTLSLDSAIWHTSDKMAVYYIGQKGGVLFGNPAPAISQTSDYRGCVLSPDVWEIGSEALGWQESIKFCRDRNLHLVSLSSLRLMEQVQVRVRQGYTGDSVPRRAWIGLRRSTLTGAWYWIDTVPFTVSNWQGAKPEDTHGGHCGTINLEPSQDFGWSPEDCCQDVHPICYREPQLFTMQ